MAEGFAFGIEHHHHLGAGEILLKTPKHADNALDGSGRMVFAGSQWWQRMVSAKQVGRSVNKNHGWGLFLSHIKAGPESD
uniref:Uncharacterized protein n=1 Tax=Marinobacter nauticus TaxID=2743 RepID=A0A455W6G8_MARNT|nr:hypothetical protein YBY_28830 [Marinobacter nauticus]